MMTALPQTLPLWPPVLATRGPGVRSASHAHHALHLVVRLAGELRFRSGTTRWIRAAGVVTGPDVKHEIDGTGGDVLLVFVDPESDVGAAMVPVAGAGCRAISGAERARLDVERSPLELMGEAGPGWTRGVVAALGGTSPAPRAMHPRVRRALRLIRERPPDGDASLTALAGAVGLSPSRFMHVFTESVGVPLRPYLAWLKLQRAAVAVVAGMPLTRAAHAAGFADAAHMTRTFRRMFGNLPSAMQQRTP